MKRLAKIVMIVLFAVLVFPAVVRAQLGGYYGGTSGDYGAGPGGSSWNIHAGAAFLSGHAKDDTTYTVGVQWETPDDDREYSSGYMTLGIDAIRIRTLAGDNEEVIPLLIGYKKYAPLGGSTRAFVNISAGARYATDDIPELRIDKHFDFGWAVKIGADISKSIFLQVGYTAGKHPSDDGATLVELGARF
jgi:hypothetical protein